MDQNFILFHFISFHFISVEVKKCTYSILPKTIFQITQTKWPNLKKIQFSMEIIEFLAQRSTGYHPPMCAS